LRVGGTLFAIGGAEAKLRRRTVLRAFLAAAGGTDARIAVVPSASSLGPEVVEVYHAVFTALGAASVVTARPESRADAQDPVLAATLDDATGVFMTGGNQLKLSSFIIGTPFADAIHAAYRRGAAVGGTSAGASIVAEHMIAFGGSGSTPKQRMSQLSVGLGLLRGVVIDQHFEQRNRYGRLLSLVAQSPSLLGIGVDEDTAAVVRQGDQLEVVGRGAVTIVDGSQLVSNAYAAKRTAPLLVSGATVHVLPAGSRFDLSRRALIQQLAQLPDHEVAEVQAAESDLRELARDIAAEGVSPTNYARRLRRSRHG
jgi:cyanophycinase